jgi:hypothetical protein
MPTQPAKITTVAANKARTVRKKYREVSGPFPVLVVVDEV